MPRLVAPSAHPCIKRCASSIQEVYGDKSSQGLPDACTDEARQSSARSIEGWVKKRYGANNWLFGPSWHARYMQLDAASGEIRHWSSHEEAMSGLDPNKCFSLTEVIGVDTNVPQRILFVYFTKDRVLQFQLYTHENFASWHDALCATRASLIEKTLPFHLEAKKLGAARPDDDSSTSDVETCASSESGSRRSSRSSSD